jgi:drug/metabolite transporter (DMT)-like permease
MRLPPGVPAILASVFAMALADAIIKLSSAGMTLWQIWVLRSVLVLPVLYVMARGRVWPVPAPWVALRCLALVAMYLTMYPALPLIDMALAGAAFYTAPLFIVGLSALVLGNRVTARHWVAILTGFAGVLVIVRPFGAAFSPVVLLPVVAAACYAGAAILTRARCAAVAPAVLGFWLNLAFLAVGGAALLALSAGLTPPLDYPFLTGPWAPMTLRAWAVIAILALLMVGIAIGVAAAYQSPRPEVVASFDYAYMIFATFWGFVFFGEVPLPWTLVGTVLITAGGLIVLTGRRA